MSSLTRTADALLEQKAVQATHHDRLRAHAEQLGRRTRAGFMRLTEAHDDVVRGKKELDELRDDGEVLLHQLAQLQIKYSAAAALGDREHGAADAARTTVQDAASRWSGLVLRVTGACRAADELRTLHTQHVRMIDLVASVEALLLPITIRDSRINCVKFQLARIPSLEEQCALGRSRLCAATSDLASLQSRKSESDSSLTVKRSTLITVKRQVQELQQRLLDAQVALASKRTVIEDVSSVVSAHVARREGVRLREADVRKQLETNRRDCDTAADDLRAARVALESAEQTALLQRQVNEDRALLSLGRIEFTSARDLAAAKLDSQLGEQAASTGMVLHGAFGATLHCIAALRATSARLQTMKRQLDVQLGENTRVLTALCDEKRKRIEALEVAHILELREAVIAEESLARRLVHLDSEKAHAAFLAEVKAMSSLLLEEAAQRQACVNDATASLTRLKTRFDQLAQHAASKSLAKYKRPRTEAAHPARRASSTDSGWSVFADTPVAKNGGVASQKHLQPLQNMQTPSPLPRRPAVSRRRTVPVTNILQSPSKFFSQLSSAVKPKSGASPTEDDVFDDVFAL